jgi:uncharacterized protein (TIGR02246 family)
VSGSSNGLVGIALAALFLAGSPTAASAADPATARTPGEVPDDFATAWNRHDMKALAGLFADRADFVNVIGLHWRGREEIERAHAQIHATRMKDSRLTILAKTVRPLRADVVLVHADWELAGDTGIEGKALPPRKGVLSFVVAQQGGRWRVEAAQNTDIVPIPNAPPEK